VLHILTGNDKEGSFLHLPVLPSLFVHHLCHVIMEKKEKLLIIVQHAIW